MTVVTSGHVVNPKVSAGRREELTRDCLGRTVVMLRQAADLDAKLAEAVRDDPALKQLLDRPGIRSVFESLVKQ